MLVPMMGFVLALTVVGGIISLPAAADPHCKWWVPYVGFTLFFAGLLAFCLPIGVSLLVDQVLGPGTVADLGFIGGYVLGGLGGALLGLRLALRRERRLVSETCLSDEEPGLESESAHVKFFNES